MHYCNDNGLRRNDDFFCLNAHYYFGGYDWHAHLQPKRYYALRRRSSRAMARPRMIKIDFYVPTKTKDGKDIDPEKVDDIINQIWPKYHGGTKLTGTGYYRAKSGKDEVTESYLLSIITGYGKPLKADLKKFKEKIRDELCQETVLITWHFITVS